MAKQTITLGLSQKSVEKALKQLRQYKQWLRNKTTELVKALAEIGIPVIETNVADASYTFDSKGVRSGSNTEHYTYVKLNNFIDDLLISIYPPYAFVSDQYPPKTQYL